MKKIITFFSFSALAVFALAMLFQACTGPEGPPGADGTDGTDGVDANSWCIQCHTLDNKMAIQTQYATSGHAAEGFALGYAGARNGCAKCHSHQGALETMMTGRDTTASNVPIPAAFKCETCHGFHMTLDSTEFPDYALRNNNPVSLIYNNHATVNDLPGTSNVCHYCHQMRARGTDFPIDPAVEKEFMITSTHWGTHYGTQPHVLNGTDAVEFEGSIAYESTMHADVASCGTCHMAEAEGTEFGGHTFRMKAEDGTPNINACTSCHEGYVDFNPDGIQDEIHEMFEELEHALMDAKLIDETLHAIPYEEENGTGVPWTTEQAGATFNFLMIEYDGSWGVHNYKYTKAVLNNTLEVVRNW